MKMSGDVIYLTPEELYQIFDWVEELILNTVFPMSSPNDEISKYVRLRPMLSLEQYEKLIRIADLSNVAAISVKTQLPVDVINEFKSRPKFYADRFKTKIGPKRTLVKKGKKGVVRVVKKAK